MRSTAKPAPPRSCSNRASAPPSAGVTERQRTSSRAIATGSARSRMSALGTVGERIGPVAVRAFGAAAEAELDQKDHPQDGERKSDDLRDRALRVETAGKKNEQVERGIDAEEQRHYPGRQIAVIGALGGQREFQIGEAQVRDGAQALAFDDVSQRGICQLRGGQKRKTDPERLAADAAVEAGEQVDPVHADLERVPSEWAAMRSTFHALAHVHFGKPVSTFPGHALIPQ